MKLSIFEKEYRLQLSQEKDCELKELIIKEVSMNRFCHYRATLKGGQDEVFTNKNRIKRIDILIDHWKKRK